MTPEEREVLERYGDILDLPRPVSALHPPMPAAERAAQFAPFAALTGLDEVMAESDRRTQETVLREQTIPMEPEEPLFDW